MDRCKRHFYFIIKEGPTAEERNTVEQIKHIMSNVITNTTFLCPTAYNFIDLGGMKSGKFTEPDQTDKKSPAPMFKKAQPAILI